MQRNDNNRDYNDRTWIDVPSFVNKGNDLSQVSGKLKKGIEDYDDSNEFVRAVNSSLAKQVSYDMDRDRAAASAKSSKKRKKKKKSKALRNTFITLLTLSAVCCFLMFTPIGQKFILTIAGDYIYGNLEHDKTKATMTEYKDDIVNILLIGVEESSPPG
jgi:hypothetical protein